MAIHYAPIPNPGDFAQYVMSFGSNLSTDEQVYFHLPLDLDPNGGTYWIELDELQKVR